MNRDPRLPPPDVCDWLLEQDWSGIIPLAVTQYPKGHPNGLTGSGWYECRDANATIGANALVGFGRFRISKETYDVLVADQQARGLACQARAEEVAGILDDAVEGEVMDARPPRRTLSPGAVAEVQRKIERAAAVAHLGSLTLALLKLNELVDAMEGW
jgi:hypothetical protein